MKLVRLLVTKFIRIHPKIARFREDIFQEGLIYLLKSVDAYIAFKNRDRYEFSTFLGKHLEGVFQGYLARNISLIAYTSDSYYQSLNAKKAASKYKGTNLKEKCEFVKKELGFSMSLERVFILMETNPDIKSLDTPLKGDDSFSLKDMLEDDSIDVLEKILENEKIAIYNKFITSVQPEQYIALMIENSGISDPRLIKKTLEKNGISEMEFLKYRKSAKKYLENFKIENGI